MIISIYKISISISVFILSITACSSSPCVEIHTKIIEKLKNNSCIKISVEGCGATVDNSTVIYFYDKLKNENLEEVFFAYHSSRLLVQKISEDSIKIIHSGYDIVRKRNEVNGIHFIYENDPLKISADGITVEIQQ